MPEENNFQKAEDWFGEHNFFSRLIILAVVCVLVYSFITPLDTSYVTIAAYLTISIFVLVSFGINSIKIIGDIILKIKGK